MRIATQRPILVVEDNEDDVFFLRRGFQKANLDPVLHVAADGKEAMEYLTRLTQAGVQEALSPALILLDLQLPHFTGVQVLEWLRRDQTVGQIPVVVLTSSSNEADIRRAYAAGANAYLVKPSDLDQQTRLAEVIHQFWLGFNLLPARRA